MITITVKLGAFLRNKVQGHNQGELQLALPGGSLVSDAIAALGLTLKDVRLALLNHCTLSQDEVLNDGDRLSLFPPQLAYNMYVAICFANRIPQDKPSADSPEAP
ncbi:MAG: MoaD/ThiS family protein [Deltaproteobacteria bacterium]|nr:MoaD/ThiS family protein [Deltaproteobacteria bacterium]MBF0524732.1 MoaD/ThiS family protein [Deltaproteobacteria bacterium]